MNREKKQRKPLSSLLRQISFRKRGTLYIGFAILLIAATLLLYVFSGLFRQLDVPLRTVAAVQYESGVGLYSSGYLVRKEVVLASDSAITSLALAEGQKAGAGQIVAMGYTTAEAQQRQTQIAKNRQLLQQLEYAGEDAAGYESAALDVAIRERLVSAAIALGRGDTATVSELAPKLKGMVLRAGSDAQTLAEIRTRIDALKHEIADLQAQSGADTQNIYATSSGYFSGVVDGYETVLTPERLESLAPSELAAVTPLAQPAGALGKLIIGDTWYYVTAVDSSDLQSVHTGDRVGVTFAHDLNGEIQMTVSHVSPDENGKSVLVLSCNRYLRDVTMLRWQSANLVFATYSGLRVPKEAVRVIDGETGVYILENTSVRFKPIEILYDNGETYIVTLDRTSTSNLWPGDAIILDEKDIYSGKVVLQ
ncbi:MAG: hypothetical protein IJS31_00645 [Oscillospiraceae bacterium]|nr:hypothetical protein [Oscillospiraceae bacterium]